MPDIIDASGLTVDTASEITAALVAGLQSIYGTDINTDQNSPDGQMIGILTQMAVDIRELAVAVNNNFDPDQAVGTLLDQRVTINNIQRHGGTFTIQPVVVVTSATVDLQGLNTSFNDPNGTGYTIQDSSGNQFILESSTTLTAGTHTVNFRARNIGAVSVPTSTITTPVTIVLGVTSVNNATGPLTVGEVEETDAQLRTRRAQSVALSSTGYLNGLLGAILELTGVTEAVLYENVSDSVDGDGTPPHCIWLVVAGGVDADIAEEIYNRKSYGCDMRGSVTEDITTASGIIFTAKWDVPTPEPLYINFTIKTTVPGFVFDQTAIKQYMVDNLLYNIGAFSETSLITDIARAAIADQGGGGVPLLVEISDDDISFTDYLAAATPAAQFIVSSANIDITVI